MFLTDFIMHRRGSRWLAPVWLVILGCTQLTAQADPANVYTQDPGADKLVSIPLEHPTRNIATLIEGIFYRWVEDTDITAQDSAYTRVPNNDLPVLPAILGGSPTVEFDVNFVSTGTHYIYFRHRSPNQNDNSLHVFFDDGFVDTHEFTVNTDSIWETEQIAGTLNVTTTGQHTIQILMREDGTSVDHLTISDNPNLLSSSLPFKLLSLEGEARGDFNRIHWTTTNEIATDRFLVQRFTQRDWITVGERTAKNIREGTHEYEWTDPADGSTATVLYRLLAYDLDGSHTVSRTVSVRSAPVPDDLRFFPNPARDRLHVLLDKPAVRQLTLTVVDAMGRRVLERQCDRVAGSTYTDLPLETLPDGIYRVSGTADGRVLRPQPLVIRR
ncbi:T9SS type A sorting domain-containing protein [Lewinella sp. JB7]|uniref:T9SS type A sorting domain-containing protein n=1 Tax=Lewinella sp. JB7 TaxID=2962887 RepID=UPI0020C9767B|nr:T9SS type A sorting domain-containing protein [Lewinella sp. JB7]MCP9236479.1 hypothetical protein [Lewinella sp. JB7]